MISALLAAKYATPIMVPPTVANVGFGKPQHDVVAVMGGIEIHRRIPLSLDFDHRCMTGGEAARFLAAMIQDLEIPQ
jgi:pyruvate dehydrogenase E2 component (dihydrolipoamide acetyltransferase)